MDDNLSVTIFIAVFINLIVISAIEFYIVNKDYVEHGK